MKYGRMAISGTIICVLNVKAAGARYCHESQILFTGHTKAHRGKHMHTRSRQNCLLELLTVVRYLQKHKVSKVLVNFLTAMADIRKYPLTKIFRYVNLLIQLKLFSHLIADLTGIPPIFMKTDVFKCDEFKIHKKSLCAISFFKTLNLLIYLININAGLLATLVDIPVYFFDKFFGQRSHSFVFLKRRFEHIEHPLSLLTHLNIRKALWLIKKFRLIQLRPTFLIKWAIIFYQK